MLKEKLSIIHMVPLQNTEPIQNRELPRNTNHLRECLSISKSTLISLHQVDLSTHLNHTIGALLELPCLSEATISKCNLEALPRNTPISCELNSTILLSKILESLLQTMSTITLPSNQQLIITTSQLRFKTHTQTKHTPTRITNITHFSSNLHGTRGLNLPPGLPQAKGLGVLTQLRLRMPSQFFLNEINLIIFT